MTPLHQQLVATYRAEHRIYARIKDLVAEQVRIMEDCPEPRVVLRLCARVEDAMAQIAALEEAIEPAKRQWQADRADPEGDLDQVLGVIEADIERISDAQRSVQDALLGYMQAHRTRTEGARSSIRTSRARRRYRTG